MNDEITNHLLEMRTTGLPALRGRCSIARRAINDYNMEFYWSCYSNSMRSNEKLLHRGSVG